MTILYRPVGPQELDLIREANWSRFPPRLPETAHFLPGVERGVRETDRARLERKGKRSRICDEVRSIWQLPERIRRPRGWRFSACGILDPAEQLDEFNQNILGKIEVVAEFRPERSSKE